MGLSIPVLNSCCCLSLRTAALIAGGIQVFFYSLYLVHILIMVIRYTVMEHIVKFDDLIRDLLYTYVDVFNIVFSVILIIGILKENSGFVVAWLLIELTHIMDLIWNSILTSYFFFHGIFFVEELILIGFELMCTWIGYSYYTTMPKNNKYIF